VTAFTHVPWPCVRAESPHAICGLLLNQLTRPSQCILRIGALSKNREEKSTRVIKDLAKVTTSIKVTVLVGDKMISYCLIDQQKRRVD
jgi:mannose-6-phosphate isomerase class I